MTDVERGKAILRRRLAQGFKSERQFAAKSGVSREAIKAAETGTAREDTYQRLEAFLDEFEHEVGEDLPGIEIEQLQYTIDGKDVTVTVKGPVSNRAELEKSVANIIRSIRESSPPTGSS